VTNLRSTDVLKVLLIFFVFVGSVYSVNATSSESIQEIEIYLKPEIVEIHPYESTVIDLVLVNGSSVGVVDVYIEYNDKIIEIVNVSSKYNFEYTKTFAHNSHVVPVLYVKVFLENESVKNQSKIASITLKGIKEGEAFLQFLSFPDVYDKNGKPMKCSVSGLTRVLVKAINKAEINFSDSIIPLDPFEEASVSIILKNGSKINTLKIYLKYNKNTIRIENVTSPFKIEDIELKGETLNITILTLGKLNDNATSIVNLTIKALSKGFTVIEILRAEGYDVNGTPLYLSQTFPYAVEIVVGGAVPEGITLIEPIMALIFTSLITFIAILTIVLVVIIIIIFLICKARKKGNRLYYYIAAAIFIALLLFLISEFQ